MNKQQKYKQVISAVCDYFNLSEAEIKTKSRKTIYAKPRHICYWYLRELYGLRLVDIGDMFDRNYTSVISGIQVVQDCIDTQSYLYDDIQELNAILKPENKPAWQKIVIEFQGSPAHLIKAVNESMVKVINYELL